MTLALDLSDKQEVQVEKVLLANAVKRKEAMANREERKELSKEEKMTLAEARMDQKIATKRAFKDILDDEQYTRFEKIAVMKERNKRGHRNHKRGAKK